MTRSSMRLRFEQLEDRIVPSSPGDIDWLRQFGSVLPGSAVGRAVDSDGNIYIGGSMNGAWPGQISAGSFDAYVRKLDAAGNLIWTRQFGTASFDFIQGIAADASGIYVVGGTFGTLPGQVFVGGFSDAFIRKYDADGNELWTRQFGSTFEADTAADVAVNSTGVYVAGTLHAPSGVPFLRKYDASGNLVWLREFTLGGQGNGVAVDASGVYVSGFLSELVGIRGGFVSKYDVDGTQQWIYGTAIDARLSGKVAVDATGFYFTATVGGHPSDGSGSDVIVAKFNFAGNVLWSNRFGATIPPGRVVTDQAYDIAVDASGVYIAGTSNGFLDSLSGSGAFVRKYDTGGNQLWTRHFGVTAPPFGGGGSAAYGIALDASGVFVVGETSFSFPGQTSTGGLDVFLRKYDANGTALFTRQYATGAPATDTARAVDTDGNVYVTGQLPGRLPDQLNAGIVGAFVRKYDAAGTELWTRILGFPATVTSIAVDGSGIYLAGWLSSNVLPGQPNVSQDAFVSKYDANGNQVWTRPFGAPPTPSLFAPQDAATSVVVDASGVYVTGTTDGTFPGQANAGGVDTFVRKYDTAGTELWTRQFGSAGTEQALGIAVTASDVYVTGNTTTNLPGQTSAGGQDAFVRKYDGDGTELWTRQFGTSTVDSANGIAADAYGIYVAGGTFGTLPGQASAGSNDAFVRMYDASGAEVWTRQFGSATSDQVNGVAVGPTGVYVAGFTFGTLPGQSSAGSQDAFVGKYDAGGGAIWTRQFGTASTDSAAGVAVGTSGLYVAGFTNGLFAGQIGAGGQDAFVAKIVDSAANTAPSNLVLNLNANVAENGTATLNGSFTDPDASDTHTVVINWGPGEGSTPLNLAAGVTTFSASHSYLDDNPTGTASDVYTVSATVTEPAGGSASSIAAVAVNNAAPVVSITSPTSGSVFTLGTPITFSGAFTDAGTADTHTAQWTFDTVTSAGAVTQGSGSGIVSGNFTFSAPGVYTVMLTVTDDDGGTGTAQVMITIDRAATATAASVSASTPLFGVNGLTVSAVVSAAAAGGGTPTGKVTFFDGATALGTADLLAGAASLTLGPTILAAGPHTIRAVYGGDTYYLGSDSAAAVNVLAPSAVQGLVYVDADNDGQVDFGERAVADVTVTLTGTDDLGHAVNRTVQTDVNGIYAFINLRPSNGAGYTLTETQPFGLIDGRDTPGTVNGMPTGSNSTNDTLSGIVMATGGSSAENYNFGERPATTGGVVAGQTATIGYWQNNNGQRLIRSLNGGADATQLGHWLAVTLPNMYGALDGKTNAQIADVYRALFARTASTAPGGPPKTDAQVMATAFAVYVTNQTLAGTTAAAYGFQVSATGVGTRTFNVGANGAAFGVANNTSLSVMDLLLAVNVRSRNGLLYDQDGNGQISGSEAAYRTMANNVFSGINEAGDI